MGVGEKHRWQLLSGGRTGGIHPSARAGGQWDPEQPWMCPGQAVPCQLGIWGGCRWVMGTPITGWTCSVNPKTDTSFLIREIFENFITLLPSVGKWKHFACILLANEEVPFQTSMDASGVLLWCPGLAIGSGGLTHPWDELCIAQQELGTALKEALQDLSGMWRGKLRCSHISWQLLSCSRLWQHQGSADQTTGKGNQSQLLLSNF